MFKQRISVSLEAVETRRLPDDPLSDAFYQDTADEGDSKLLSRGIWLGWVGWGGESMTDKSDGCIKQHVNDSCFAIELAGLDILKP